MKTRILTTLVVIVMAIIISFSLSIAQGFQGILKKLATIELQLKKLETIELQFKKLESAQKKDTQELRKDFEQLKSLFPIGLSDRIEDISARVDASTAEIEKVKATSGNSPDTEGFEDLTAELHGLIAELRATIENQEMEENQSEVEQSIESNISAGVDLVSRYIWRGINFGDAPSIQPALTFSKGGFEVGFWGAYTFSNGANDADENDIWASYTIEFANSSTLTAIFTDYYFPNAGVKFFNFNNHDDEDGSGAHTLEAGLSYGGPETFPVSVTAYVNFYNDAGKNAYFEVAYSANVQNTDLNFFAGASSGSKENPGYYGTDKFAFINVGVSAGKEVTITENFSIPLSISYIVNPELEVSYLIFGISF